MNCTFTKLRESADLYDVDLVLSINPGDALSNPRVVIERGEEKELIDFGWYPAAPWVDVTSEFGITGQAVSGSKVQFKVAAAATADEQAVGTYRLTVLADANPGARVVGARKWLRVE